MPPKKPEAEKENKERWLLTYADMITLLLALFVILYSTQKLDEVKFGIIADQIQQAFKTGINQGILRTSVFDRGGSPNMIAGLTGVGATIAQELVKLGQKTGELDPTEFSITASAEGVTIALSGDVLFASGSDRLLPVGQSVLETVARQLALLPNPIQVDGHTDSVPPGGQQFPTNWELSVARAATVARYLSERGGVAPERLSAFGYAETRPLGPGKGPQDRARNRRVEIRVLPAPDEKPGAVPSALRAVPTPTPVRYVLPPILRPQESSRVPNPCKPTADAATGVVREPVCFANLAPEVRTFVDPTATVRSPEFVELLGRVYVGPFVRLLAGNSSREAIFVGDESDLQDNVTIEAAGRGTVRLGTKVIVAHGATVRGPAKLGVGGGEPVFVGFNAEVDGATLEAETMVMHLARVGPGVTLKKGTKVLPGRNVASQAEADDPQCMSRPADSPDYQNCKVARVSEADRRFMESVVEVNTAFAQRYALLFQESPPSVRGIGPDPGGTVFNEKRDLPLIAGIRTLDPGFRNRIIGDVRVTDPKQALDQVMGAQVALRADEGEPLVLGRIASMGDRVTIHALEHTALRAGHDVRYGAGAVIHAGTAEGQGGQANVTVIGDGAAIGDGAVVFRSTIGTGATIGARAVVDGSEIPPGQEVPDGAIIVNNVSLGTVEWQPSG